MAGKKKANRAQVVPDDLPSVVREAARGAFGLSRPNITKRLPVPYQKLPKETEQVLNAMVKGGELYAFKKGPARRYFADDPRDRLDALVSQGLSEPLTEAQLKAWLSKRVPGCDAAFKEWLKRATTHGVIFQHHPLPPSKTKRFGREIDLTTILGGVVRALRTALPKADAKGIPRQRLAQALLAEMGLSAPHSNGAPRNGRSDFLAALDRLAAEDPSSSLLSVRDLRRRLPLNKNDFDELALRLAREGVVSLHYHDYPASLPESERNELVVDVKGTHYIGIAPRGRR